MNTISSKVKQKELEAITEFANMCGETTSNLIRKVLLHYATFQGGFHDTTLYDVESIPETTPDNEYHQRFEQNINRIRNILGIPTITL